MKFLGLDLSTTNTGMVRVESLDLALDPPWPRPGLELLVAPKSNVLEDRIDAILNALLANLGVDLVAIEALAGGGVFRGSSLIPLAKLHGVIEHQLRALRIPYVTVAPASWRKALLGRGNVPKTDVKHEVWKRYQYEHASIDVVEAWAVAVYACRQRQGLLDLPPPRPKRSKRA